MSDNKNNGFFNKGFAAITTSMLIPNERHITPEDVENFATKHFSEEATDETEKPKRGRPTKDAD